MCYNVLMDGTWQSKFDTMTKVELAEWYADWIAGVDVSTWEDGQWEMKAAWDLAWERMR